jgi:hypothetical protein
MYIFSPRDNGDEQVRHLVIFDSCLQCGCVLPLSTASKILIVLPPSNHVGIKLIIELGYLPILSSLRFGRIAFQDMSKYKRNNATPPSIPNKNKTEK